MGGIGRSLCLLWVGRRGRFGGRSSRGNGEEGEVRLDSCRAFCIDGLRLRNTLALSDRMPTLLFKSPKNVGRARFE